MESYGDSFVLHIKKYFRKCKYICQIFSLVLFSHKTFLIPICNAVPQNRTGPIAHTAFSGAADKNSGDCEKAKGFFTCKIDVCLHSSCTILTTMKLEQQLTLRLHTSYLVE